MKNSIFSKIAYVLILVLVPCTLTGCDLIPTISTNDEQTELVAEYAAGLLAKYEKGHSMGLVKVNGLDMEALYATPTPTPIVAVMPEIPEEIDTTESGMVDSLVNDGSTENNSSEAIEITLTPLNEAFGFYGASLDFTYLERCDSYPNSEDQLLFSMNASEGNDLVIAHFNLCNYSGEEQSYLTNLNGYKVRFVVNDEEKYRCDFTILTNDLTSYSGKVQPGDNVDAVLIFEIPKDKEIYSLDLMLVNGQDQMRYELYQ